MAKQPKFKDGDIVNHHRYGDIEVIKYNSATDIDIRFIDTGTVRKTSAGKLSSGGVKDNMQKSVYGVACIGYGDFKSRINGKLTIEYSCWQSMIARCYSGKNPTYSNCTVCDEWLNFQNFAKWHADNHPKDGATYDLDKDILFDGNKVYSPETCIFVSHTENMIKATAKSYRFKSPDGDVVEIYNLEDFCRKNNLSSSSMCLVHSGKRISHKGWRLA